MDISGSSTVVLVGAHPDDVKSYTGMMLRGIAGGAKVCVVSVTNGERLDSETYEQAQEMALRRKEERDRFLSSMGIPQENLFLFGFPDGGGLSAMRNDFWQDRGEPFYAPLLRADRATDTSAWRQGAPFFGETLLDILKELITRLAPTHVFTHHPRDDHPDHRAMAFFVKKAVSDLVAAGRLEQAPKTYAGLVYFSRIQWPPAGDTFLSAEFQALSFSPSAIRFELTPEELEKKRETCTAFAPTLSEALGEDYIRSYMKNDELYWEL